MNKEAPYHPSWAEKTMLFTDGSCPGNGKADCRASWAWLMLTEECADKRARGLVPGIDIPGKVYRTSNNRGELLAILSGLRAALAGNPWKRLVVTSDSGYAIDTITTRLPEWIKNGNLHMKKNIDLLLSIHEVLQHIKDDGVTVSFQHIYSHQKEPTVKDSEPWALWCCNEIANDMCTEMFHAS